MKLRRDHVAGGAFVVAGLAVLAASGELPFGTLASPGAGMMPAVVTSLMMLFGALLVVRAGASPPLGEVSWSDFPHALRVMLIAAVATGLYTVLGFIITMSLMLFALTFGVERKRFIQAMAISIGVTVLAYVLFTLFLKSPLPRGMLGF